MTSPCTMNSHSFKIHAWLASSFRTLLLGGLAWLTWAQPTTAQPITQEPSLSAWLLRMHEASERNNYIGTIVVSSPSQLVSSRIWHACDGLQQIERVDSLNGVPRSTFRRGAEVLTFLPQTSSVVAETREALALFPHLLKNPQSDLERFYGIRLEEGQRVAGLQTDLVHLYPRDKLRYGYRIWSERRTGLVVKLQTMSEDGQVLEQTAFSELQIDAPVSIRQMARMMGNTRGYKIERPILTKTSLEAEGWHYVIPAQGFKATGCYRRTLAADVRAEPVLQCVFTDGLASVSLFLETFDPRLHLKEGQQAVGATQALTRRLGDPSRAWWLTAVGEVPLPTLAAFARSLERN